MSRTKILVLGGLLSGLAFLFQLAPVLFSETFALVTMLSALPIYIITAIKPRAGIMSFISVCLLVLIFSLHEGFIFFFINGPLGLSLGICSYYYKNTITSMLISGSILACTLALVSYGLGFPVFGTDLPGTIWVQLGMMFTFAFVYSYIYLLLCRFMYRAIEKLVYR